MVDFRTITIISKNHAIENTIAENQAIRSKNELLALIGISAGVLIIIMAIHYAKEENKREKAKYSTML